MTAPRIIVPGATTSITRRTTLRKAYLAPWHPLVPKVWLYALADAQRRTDVAIHHAINVVNHHHLTVTPQTNNLPEFVRHLHRDISSALNVLLTRERYDAPRELFDGRSAHYMRLLDAGAQASQLVYEHNNCVAAGLVARPEQMPGSAFDFELWRTGYIDVERPPIYFASDRPEQIRLYVTPPPLLFAAFGGDLDWLIYHMRRTSDAAGQTLRSVRARPPMGAHRLTRLHPWSEPQTEREAPGASIPTFRIGARGILGGQTAVAAARETHDFRADYRDARVAHHAGNHTQLFPYGTYEMRVRHGAAVATEPKPGALVALPGPLLRDVEAELAAELRPSAREVLREQTTSLLDELREALREESADLRAHDELDFSHDPHSDSHSSVDASMPPRTVIVRHRFDQRPSLAKGDAAQRVVVLRDSRHGHPSSSRRHGADPPR
jgi:hypothetical protein